MGLPKIAILICSFNESKTLAKVVRDASKFGKVLVINDGSTDNTKEMIKKFKVFKINNTVNEGYENCIIKGLRFLKSKKFSGFTSPIINGRESPIIFFFIFFPFSPK